MHDALEARHVAALAAVAVLVADVDALAVGAEQEGVADLLVQVLPRGVQVDLPLVGDGRRHLLVVVRGAGRPGQDRPLGQRQRRVGHDQLGIDLHLRPQAGAARAGAVGRVEGEDARLELGHRGAAVQAREALGEGLDLAGVHQLEVDQALGQADRGLDRVGQPLAQVRAHDQPVDHDRDVVLVALVEVELLLEPPQLAVDLDAGVALGPQLLEQLAVLALAPADHGRLDHEPGALLEGHDLVHDLLGRLGGDRAAAVVAVGLADPGPQQAQVVVDLGDRAHGRARVARGGLLVDRDGRRQALDRVHVGLVHLAQELARVGAQGLDVAALALGVDGVEGQRRLARAGQAGDDHQRVPRQADVDVLEVVLARAGDDELV